MNKEKIKRAIFEATRFVDRATELLKVEGNGCTNPRESGATRRASMDLTRALADMRRPE